MIESPKNSMRWVDGSGAGAGIGEPNIASKPPGAAGALSRWKTVSDSSFAVPPPPSAEEAAALKAEERRLKRLHNARRRALAEGIHREEAGRAYTNTSAEPAYIHMQRVAMQEATATIIGAASALPCSWFLA